MHTLPYPGYFKELIILNDRDLLSPVLEKTIILNSAGLVYPNPSDGLINIEFENSSENDVQITIVSLDGAVVETLDFSVNESPMNKLSLNLHHLKSGVYIINVFDVSGIRLLTKKCIIY